MLENTPSPMQLQSTDNVLQQLHSPLACLENIDEISNWFDNNWFEFVVHCSELMICSNLPSLLDPIGEKLSIPVDMKETLEAVRDANSERNYRLLQEYELVKNVLSEACVNPVPLKGIAILAQNIYPDNGRRMISDIDLAITPDELPSAIQALRHANYLQMANRYDAKNLKTDASFLPIDESDFRNSIEFVDCHIPRIIRPGNHDTLELHVHVTNKNSILSPWLDTHARKNDPLFHLIHNFEHSHRKDTWASLGLIDWRHLMDTARRFQLDSSGTLPKAMMRVASNHKLEADMAVHLYQLQRYLKVPGLNELIEKPQHQQAIAAFELCHNSRKRQRAAAFQDRFRKGIHGLFSLSVLRERYGPKPLPVALLKSVGFYGSRILRGDLSQTP